MASRLCSPTVVLLLFLLATTLAFGDGTNQTPQKPIIYGPNEKIPLIRYIEVPFETAIEHLARQAMTNYILDAPTSPSKTVNTKWENMTAIEALARVLKTNNLILIADPVTGVAQITRTGRAALPAPAPAEWVAAGTNDVFPLIQFQIVPLRAALEALARTDGTAIAIEKLSPSRQPDVSVRWENIRPRQAIAALCKTYHLAIVVDKTSGQTRIVRE